MLSDAARLRLRERVTERVRRHQESDDVFDPERSARL
jgi:hypothetical protein